MPHCLYRLDVIYTDNNFSSQNSLGTSKEITCKEITCKEITCKEITCKDITCKEITCKEITCKEITCKEITCKIELSFQRKRFAAGVPSREHSHERESLTAAEMGYVNQPLRSTLRRNPGFPSILGVSKLTNGRVKTSRGDLGSHT